MMAAARQSRHRTLGQLLDGIVRVPREHDREVADLTFDSRAVLPGSVFFARRGERVDAAAFAHEAHRRGAAAMVLESDGAPAPDADGLLRVPVAQVVPAAGQVAHRFFGEPSERLAVIAVTGTNGKTSVSHFVAEALERHRAQPVGVLGTLGQALGGSVREGTLTTPDCIAVHRAMAEFAAGAARIAVLEASSHALVQQRLAGLRVHTGVFTNLSRDHLDYHGDMRAYARAKARLFALPGLAAAVINADDAAAGEMRAALAGATRVVDFSFAPHTRAAVHARVLRNDAGGVELDIRGEHGDARIASALPGLPAAWNLLTAWCVLRVHGVDGAGAAGLLSRASAVPGRMQALGGGAAPLVVVDYAHTPAALAAALDALRPLCRARLWCVFGAGGERDAGKRPLMGEAAALRADRLVITDDNPRGEDGDAIVAQILGGVPVARRTHLQVERARARAIELAIGAANAGDVILIAGKGHELYQDLCGRRVPFSDLAVARAALEGAGR